MEFHAFILCGPGKGLSPFSHIRSSGKPKALLPVANRPMIENVLDWCEMAFFPKVTVVVNEDSELEILAALNQYRERVALLNKSKQLEDGILPYTSEINVLKLESEFSGSILYHIYQEKLIGDHENFVILPCDFITNLPPQVLIEAYRNKSDSDVGMIVNYRNTLDIEDKKTKVFPENFTIYSELSDDQHKFLDLYSTEDVDFHKSLKIRTQMCWRYPNTIISQKLLNASIFFGSNVIFKVFDSQSDKFNESYFECRSIIKIIRDVARRSWRHSKPFETISMLIVPKIATFYRLNNTPVLMEANRRAMQEQASQKAQQSTTTPAPVREKNAANIGIDSLVGDDTVIGERTNVKKTVIGKNCQIGKRVKLTGNLIMDNVVIHDDVQLENCIIGSDVVIKSKSKLTNCNVESTHEVAHGTHSKGETLLSLTLEGIVDEDLESAIESESDSEDDSDESDYDDIEYDDNADGLFDY